tara:strand:- start:2613 stop:4319 length:1707 start_codon:yes stop_codon:yes gene_type:complete
MLTKKSLKNLMLVFLVMIYSCEREQPIFGENGMVVSTSRQASQVGIDIMKAGGNAIDAAAAVGFALAVTSSSNGNIGGGGFMTVKLENGNSFTLDYREMAPEAASRNMYLDGEGNIIKGKSRYTHFAAGVPGSVDGLLKAWRDYGSGNISREELLDPAINLAENGFKLSKYEAERFNKNKDRLSKHPETKRIFTRDDREWKEGDLFLQEDLANTLKRILKNGRDGFYKGKTADLIVKEMETVGEWINYNDLENYVSKYRDPVKGSFMGYDILSMGPPSSGGLLVIHMLNMLEKVIEQKGSDLDLSYNSVKYIHTLTELERRAYADRTEHMGDSDFWDVPQRMFLSNDYAKSRLQDIDFNKATSSKSVNHGNPYANQSEETTHYSIVDKKGNAVSVTTTINAGYGNGITVTGAGFILNNEMDDFSSKPGEPNMFGLLGNEANAIEPMKRPLSSMTPTIVLKDDTPFLILGSPGGSTIITTVMQNILNVVLHDMNIKDAVSSPRVHSQWLPDMIFHEKNGLKNSTIYKLKKMGHDIRMRSSIGEANGIMINEKGFWGGADNRGENTAIGY